MAVPVSMRQSEFDRRFEWGPIGVDAISDGAIVVVVDVLRFSTAVDAGTSRGAAVYPYRWADESAIEYARSLGAVLVGGFDPKGPSRSPKNLFAYGLGDSVVLPSPNGSMCATLAVEAGARVVVGCLRNAAAIGAYLRELGQPVGVIGCGERWPDGSLRPAVEDYLGAGAILSHLGGRPSPEAEGAIAAWRDSSPRLESVLLSCGSGLELSLSGQSDDVRFAAEADVSDNVPLLRDGAFRSIAFD